MLTRRRRLPPPQTLNHPRQAGFVLVAALFAIALMAAGAAYFAGRIDAMRSDALVLTRVADTERDAYSATQVLIHAYLTERERRPGWPYANSLLRFDGRPYQISDSLTLRVQDERGLQSLNFYDGAQLENFLAWLGATPALRNRLRAVLEDYSDADDLRRLNGAEKVDYAAEGLPPPANDLLRHRSEIQRMLVWRDLKPLVEARLGVDAAERFAALFSVSRAPGININTAPASLLSSLPGIDPARVSALIDQRAIKVFETHSEIIPFANGPVNFESILLVPAWTWRVAVGSEELPFLLECRVQITTLSRQRPAGISECQRSPRAAFDSSPDSLFSAVLAPARGAPETSAAPAPPGRSASSLFSPKPSPLAKPSPTNDQRPSDRRIETADWIREHLVSSGRASLGTARP